MKHKVLFVVSSLDSGGAQKVISNITTSLPGDWELDILLNSDKSIVYPYEGSIYSLGIREPKDRNNLLYQAVVLSRRLKTIRRLKKVRHYDSVVSILTSANVANVLTKTPDCKTVITEVIMPSESPTFKEKYIIGRLNSIFYKRADLVVVETKAIAYHLINATRVSSSKIRVIPNSINVGAIREEAAKPLSDEESILFDRKRTIVTAGRMEYQKGQWHLVRAFSKVVEAVPDAKLVIFGQGELYRTLLELIQSLHLEGKAVLHGFTKDLNKYLANCRVFVLPSMFEGMPTALLQAMAVGTPCIVSDFFSGAREVLGDEETPEDRICSIMYTKYGIMTPVCSGAYLSSKSPLEEAEVFLTEAIIRMLKDDELFNQYSDAVQKRIKDFDNETIIREWMEVL